MTQPWWRGCVIYHVYVRSFFDSDGDGYGDLAGVLARLDHIERLGVDAIWLSPIHPSPDRDWGYDVSDYDGVHAELGDLETFQALLQAAHARGLKVLLDEVLAHTSDEHPWFADSLAGGARRDWYVWAEPGADGGAPNNWLSVFGGPAWAYQPARRAHYHHKFLRQQPKLNWREPAAREAALSVLDLWLDRGVDGFRLDVANAFLHDAALTDNPPAERTARTWEHASDLQRHVHDANLPETVETLDAVRRRVEAHGDRFVFGEFSEEPERCGAYAASDEGLHAGYTFVTLNQRTLNAGFLHDHLTNLAGRAGHWPCLSFSNHDVPRTASRFGPEHEGPAFARLMNAVLLCLRGTVLIYQGEELGLTQSTLRRDQLRDPVGDLYWPYTAGRDGCRTPMPWRGDAENLGFSDGRPWLPLAPEHSALAVDRQDGDPASTLEFTRRLVALRKASPALREGDLALIGTPEPVLAFVRTQGAERLSCVFNMSGAAVETDDPLFERLKAPVLESGVGERSGRRIVLEPYGLLVAPLA